MSLSIRSLIGAWGEKDDIPELDEREDPTYLQMVEKVAELKTEILRWSGVGILRGRGGRISCPIP